MHTTTAPTTAPQHVAATRYLGSRNPRADYHRTVMLASLAIAAEPHRHATSPEAHRRAYQMVAVDSLALLYRARMAHPSHNTADDALRMYRAACARIR